MLTKSIRNTTSVLDLLRINYREFPCENGKFYFCINPVNGVAFDLKQGEDGIIRLWRFVGTAPVSKAGFRCEYRKPQNPSSLIGLEITDEGDICLYAQRDISCDDPKSKEHIYNMIKGYIKIIAHLDANILA